MKQLVVFAALLACAFAGYLPAAPTVVAGPTVLSKQIHHVPTVQEVAHVQPTYQTVHHPPITSVHHAPTSVLAKAPRIAGYAYKLLVNHNAPVAVAAPVAHAAPIAHAAYAAPVAHAGIAAAPIAAAVAGPAIAAPVAGIAGYGVGYGAGYGAVAAPVAAYGKHAAPIVSGGHIVKVGAAPVETPAVSSYTQVTDSHLVQSQQHYGVAYKTGVVNVPAVKTIAQTVQHVPVAVHSAPVGIHAVGHAGYAHGGYAHGGYGAY